MAIAVLLWMLAGLACYMLGQDFRVAGMCRLTYDATALICDTVRDKSGDACALLKVTPPQDYEFDTPLGVAKRVNRVGEIWLYVPRKSREITIRHPKWGVIRSYKFEKPLEERVVYELRLTLPPEPVTVRTDTVMLTQTLTDTLVVEHKRPRLPLRTHALLTLSGHKAGPACGLMLTLMRRHGAWVRGSWNMRTGKHGLEISGAEGRVDGTGHTPYYTGHTRHALYTITGGAIHHLGKGFLLMEGMGVCHQEVTWQLAKSEGGGYAERTDLSGTRVAAELGLGFTRKRLTIIGSATWVKDWGWQGTGGIGINF